MEIIAEIGVNHNNKKSLLMDLVQRVIDCDVDTVKLQRFKASDEISLGARTIAYQERNTSYDSQLEMARSLELSDDLLLTAAEHVTRSGKKLLVSPFDLGSAKFIKNEMGTTAVKVPSPEITNKSLIDYLAKNFRKLYLSTGASYMHEVARAIEWVKAGSVDFTELEIMHCVSQYPAPLEASNLLSIDTMHREMRLPVGMSDHSEGLLIPLATKMLGCSCLEKHVTIDKTLPGPDHSASATIDELDQLVRETRAQEVLASDLSINEVIVLLSKRLSVEEGLIKSVLGSGVKEPSFAEGDTRRQIRKSLYVNVPQANAGDPVTLANISAKRPWDSAGIDASDVDLVFGKKFSSRLLYDDLITLEDLS